MRRQQRQPSTQVLAADTCPRPRMGRALRLAVATPVIHIRRLRLADGVPVALEHASGQALCPQLLDEDLARLSIHWLLVEKYGIPLVRLEHVVERHPIDAATTLLHVPPQTPGFHIDRLAHPECPGRQSSRRLVPGRLQRASYYIQTRTSGESVSHR
ncbi:MAG: UTRA domain-containing protein [Caldilineaceae bacterium]